MHTCDQIVLLQCGIELRYFTGKVLHDPDDMAMNFCLCLQNCTIFYEEPQNFNEVCFSDDFIGEVNVCFLNAVAKEIQRNVQRLQILTTIADELLEYDVHLLEDGALLMVEVILDLIIVLDVIIQATATFRCE